MITEKRRIMKVRREMNRAVLLSAGILCLLLAADAKAKQPSSRVSLTGTDLSAWRGKRGQWQVVGETFTNPQNDRLLSSKPGMGVIVNGPVGRTSHLLSKDEFGDVSAHIEFMVSKGSNSGIYFMGRYEIQVYDSYGV